MTDHSRLISVMYSLGVLFPLPSDFTGINYTCLSLCQAMQSERLDVELVTPMVRRQARREFVASVIPQRINCLPYSVIRRPIDWMTSRTFLRKAGSKDVVYLWSGISTGLIEKLRDKDVIIVREKFNCHQGYAKRILDQEYKRLGLSVRHHITESRVARERMELDLVDYVFCPSPMVKRSMLEEGVPGAKLLLSSYGWEPARVSATASRNRETGSPLKVLFVGRVCVRKGAHLLLQYWESANIDGQLLLAGAVDDEVREMCAVQLARPDVIALGHVSEIGEVYRDADIFVFPSFEEGGPLVTYEAMGCGLPVIVSPMGAGSIACDGVHGYVRDPLDEAGWVEALQKLAGSAELRREFGAACGAHAKDYTWSKVGSRRASMLVNILEGG